MQNGLSRIAPNDANFGEPKKSRVPSLLQVGGRKAKRCRFVLHFSQSPARPNGLHKGKFGSLYGRIALVRGMFFPAGQ